MLDIAIIGGGPAGLSAAIKGASEGLKVELFEMADHVGGRPYASPRIDNVPGCPAVSGVEYAERLAEQAREFGAVLTTGAPVVALARTSDGTILLDHSSRPFQAVEARSALLAVGLAPLQPAGLEVCRFNCKPGEMSKLGGQTVAFIGGGNGSAQMAIEAAEAGADVIIVTNVPLTENVSDYLLPRLWAAGVREFIGEPTVTPVGDGRYTVSWLYKALPHVMTADKVYAFTGGDAAKRTAWLPEEIALDIEGKVITYTDDDLPYETTMPGVFVAGDIRSGNTGSITVAQGEAMAAVQTILRQYLPSLTKEETHA